MYCATFYKSLNYFKSFRIPILPSEVCMLEDPLLRGRHVRPDVALGDGVDAGAAGPLAKSASGWSQGETDMLWSVQLGI